MRYVDIPEFKDARHAWKLLRADTKIAETRRQCADKDFKRLFPEGHSYSLRDFVLSTASEDFLAKLDKKRPGHSLRHIHPKARELLLTYGRDYVPFDIGDEAFTESIQPVMGACFYNAYRLMEDMNERSAHERQFMYVEGITYGVFASPMLHAWNAPKKSQDTGIDWTFYAGSKWNRYFGVAITAEEYQHILDEVKNEEISYLSLFHQERFEQVEEVLLWILGKREPKNKGPAM